MWLVCWLRNSVVQLQSGRVEPVECQSRQIAHDDDLRCDVLNGTISYLERPLTQISRAWHFRRWISQKRYTTDIVTMITVTILSLPVISTSHGRPTRVSRTRVTTWTVAWPLRRLGFLLKLSVNGCVGRTLVFDRRTFPVLRSTCSWWVTTYVSKPSAVACRSAKQADSAFHPFRVDKWGEDCN